MNKSKLSMPAKLRKKMNKEIRSGVPTPESRVTSDDIKAGQLLSRYPAKIQKKDLSLLKSFEKIMDVKKKKKLAKHSKRTTPGMVPSGSAPKNIHVEGRRWIKTLGKQTLAKNKIMNRRKGPK